MYLRVVLRELSLIFSDRRIFSIMLIGPFFYGLIFGGVYYNGRVRQVNTMIVDQDHSALSRELSNALNASDSLEITGYGESTEDFSDAVKKGRAYVCVVIPNGFERDIKKGKQAKVVALADASNVLIANVSYRSIKSTIAYFGAGVRAKRLMMSQVPRRALRAEINPIQAEIRPLFNPSYNYSNFLLMALVCIALQQVAMMGAAIALGMDAEKAKQANGCGVSKSPLITLLGKTTSHAIVMIPLACVAMSVPFKLFNAPFRGEWATVLGATVAFVLISILSGFGIAGICKSPVFSTQVLLALSVPIFTISGATWPVFAMPHLLQHVAYVIPLTHFVSIVRKASLIGAHRYLLRADICVLWVWVCIAACWGYWAMWRLADFKNCLEPDVHKH